MAQPRIQPSFNSGEWAPSLYARVDLEKYRSAAALLRNFFVDYRGGASTRPGTKYVLQTYKSATAVRLIPFQASFTVGYVLEFGDQYIRFHYQGSPVLESALNITGATKANPCVVSVTNTYSVGDWVYITGVSGMTQLNGRYFIVSAQAAGSITLQDLFGANVNSTSYGTWTSGGTVQRVYTLASPYAAADLALLKFAQNVTELILCHPNYAPYTLQIVSAANWLLSPITFGTTVGSTSALTITSANGSPGAWYYGYAVTAVDSLGQEGTPTYGSIFTINFGTALNTLSVSWPAVAGASSYNIYRSVPSATGPIAAGVPYGFIGNVTGTSIADSNIAPDFSSGLPVARYPFAPGFAVESVTITTPGTYSVIPTVTFAAPPLGITATGVAVMAVVSSTLNGGGTNYVVGEVLTLTGGATIEVLTLSGSAIATYSVVNPGPVTGVLPTNPVGQTFTTGSGVGATFNLTYGVLDINMTENGTGYASAPAVTFSSGAAAGTAVLSTTATGNPTVPTFFQQRLVLAAPPTAPQTLYFSQPGAYYNFNTSSPVNDGDAITAELVSGSLNNIKSMISQSGGLIVFSDGGSWLINGGSSGAAVTPASIVANAQSFDGSSDLPPIVANYDVLFVSSKGSSVRDSTYNFYTNVFTGVDISVLSSHLFFGYTLTEWCWAQEPYKVVWAVRDDGAMLTLTFIKDQEFIGWAHSDTDGLFKSVCTIVEPVSFGNVNAVYTVVERTINGQTLKYVERFAERYFPNGAEDAWCVDCGLQYSGTPATTFIGGEHLAGETVTGLADGVAITPFVMAASGSFTLATAASKVTVGLPFTAQLKTMALDIPNSGEPTVQGKVKKIPAVDIRVSETLGLKIGSSFTRLVDMKDLVVGNVSSMLTGQDTQTISDLVTGDARTYLDPTYTVPGQYCIQQDRPYPATILGVMPQVEVGDTRK